VNVGLPGTGVGGIFYVLLVAWLPARELWLTLRGRSSPGRWRRVATQAALAAGIVGALWGEARLLASLPDLLHAVDPLPAAGGPWLTPAADATRALDLERVAPVLALSPFAVLGLLLAVLHALRRLVPTGAAAPVPAPVAAAPPAERARARAAA
jgi:hypothetical protein